jgi:hypothetical protein
MGISLSIFSIAIGAILAWGFGFAVVAGALLLLFPGNEINRRRIA